MTTSRKTALEAGVVLAVAGALALGGGVAAAAVPTQLFSPPSRCVDIATPRASVTVGASSGPCTVIRVPGFGAPVGGASRPCVRVTRPGLDVRVGDASGTCIVVQRP